MDLLLKFAAGAYYESRGSHHQVLAESCGKKARKVGGWRKKPAVKFEPRTHLEWFEDPAALLRFVGQGRFRAFEYSSSRFQISIYYIALERLQL